MAVALQQDDGATGRHDMTADEQEEYDHRNQQHRIGHHRCREAEPPRGGARASRHVFRISVGLS